MIFFIFCVAFVRLEGRKDILIDFQLGILIETKRFYQKKGRWTSQFQKQTINTQKKQEGKQRFTKIKN
jgi:hypothetical protein